MRVATFLVSLGLLVAALGATPAPQPLTVSVTLGRDSFDLLDSVAIGVVVHNPTSSVASLRFLGPQEDVVDVLDANGTVLWSSKPPPPPHGVTFVPHRRAFNPGTTTIVVRDWSEMTAGLWSPLPGKYKIRATLLVDGKAPSATVALRFAAPLPPSSLPALHAGVEVTLTGRLDPTRGILGDAGGSATLTRRLLGAQPATPIVVRGYATDQRDGSRTFTVTRWAPLGPPAAP
jgi:hypothetical protein